MFALPTGFAPSPPLELARFYPENPKLWPKHLLLVVSGPAAFGKAGGNSCHCGAVVFSKRMLKRE